MGSAVFFNVWPSHEEFDTIVGTLWRRKEANDQMENIWKKLKALKPLFKSLNITEYKGIAERIDNARADLIQVQEEMRLRYSDSMLLQEKTILQNLEKWSLIEESILKQKARLKWIKLGDANTKYFYVVMKDKSQRKQILEIYTDDGVKLATPTSVKEEIVKFYKSLMRTVDASLPAINKETIKNGPKFTHEQQLSLCVEKVIPNIISEAQTGFIPGRKIADNIILTRELVKAYTRKNTFPRCMIKINLTKAYDSMEWIFLEKVMVELGFPKRFQDLVITCVKTVGYSIVVNGEPTMHFPTTKGLRQGDPILPFLFTIVMEYLSRSLKGLEKEKDKYHPRCSRLGIIHLSFADDLLLFVRGDITSITQLQQCLNQFYRASGLQANKTKSSIYYGGVP
uniref:Uncharacterized protein LOC104218471 n=1 Tax=Nicotiana sylvestris TaxID=4096 RepID=A0A1U7VZ38_NICSY|nr:PREDICTED: uncharacterized protein LOC104218471 [Nicotiana sylvestris]